MRIGKVADVTVNDQTGEPEWLAVSIGFGATQVCLMPVEGTMVRGIRDVVSPWDKAALLDAPSVKAGGRLSAKDLASLQRYYGVEPEDEALDLDFDMEEAGEDVDTDDLEMEDADLEDEEEEDWAEDEEEDEEAGAWEAAEFVEEDEEGPEDAEAEGPPRAPRRRRARSTPLLDIEGIEPAYSAKLAEAGLRTTDDLLAAAWTPAGRRALAKQTGLSASLILEWVNRADLMRIKGVGSEFSDLLESSGVDTVKELSRRKPDNLRRKMLEINESKHLVRRPPSLAQVEKWVEEAKTLPPPGA